MKGTDEREYVADLFYATGCFDSEYSPLCLSGALRLTEGRHVTEGNSGIILYEGLAEKYGLSLGDTLEIKNGNPDDPLVECEIAGLFEVIADGDDEQATLQTLQPYTITRTISLRIWIPCPLFPRAIRAVREMELIPLTSSSRTPLSWKVSYRKFRISAPLTGIPTMSR